MRRPPDSSRPKTPRAELEERLRVCERERLEILLGLAKLETDEVLARARYREVLALEPDHHGALDALVQLALDAWDFNEAAQLLDRRQRCEPEPGKRAELLCRLGHVRRDRLADTRGARHAFDEANAIDPTNEDALFALASDSIQRSEWDIAEPMLLTLVRTGSEHTAKEAFRTLEDELARREDFGGLADLDAVFRDRATLPVFASSQKRPVASVRLPEVDRSCERRAIESDPVADAQRDLSHDPFDVAAHRALFRAFSTRGDVDRAYCVSSALTFLGAAEPEHRTCFEAWRPRGVPAFKSRLAAADWHRDLAHPDLDRAVGGVFEVIARAARASQKARVPKATREDPTTTRSLVAKAFFGAANVLGVGDVELWVSPDREDGITALPTSPSASLGGTRLASGWSVPELMFLFGEHLVQHHGEHAVRAGFEDRIPLLYEAALHLVRPRQSTDAGLLRTANALRRELAPEELERLRSTVEGFSTLASPDPQRWLSGSRSTALRAALLLCGDLAVAVKVVEDRGSPEQVGELLRFLVSDAHWALRKSLRIAVRPTTPSGSDGGADDDEPTRERALCA